MADRTVVYRLRVEAAQFRAQMAAAAGSTKQLGSELGSSLNTKAMKASSALDGLGINVQTVAIGLGTAAVMASANFEAAMSKVSSATGESAANMELLRQAALDAGSQTVFSATEAADGIEQLAKAGVSTQAILDGGLTGALNLAAAGEMSVGDAAEVAAKAMTQFGLAGDQVPHIADLLASAAASASGEVSDFGYALSQAGLVADQVGLSIEETTGGLAAFASAGLLGSDAGTSFKSMLGALTPNSKKAAAEMERLGLSAYDSQGNFIGLSEFAGQLQTSLAGMTAEQRQATLETIFGSDAIRAASVLYEQGADGIQTWIDKVDDQGAAAEMASERLDNLKGDVEALQGALETAMIQQGDSSLGALRNVTQLATDVVNLTSKAQAADGVMGGLWDSTTRALNPLGNLTSIYSDAMESIRGTDEPFWEVARAAAEQAVATDTAGQAVRSYGAVSQEASEEIKAQEEAMQDARDAAQDIADAFVNLGGDVDDAKVSLGQWIQQMADQADALNNFMNNAKAASKRGLRDGLIRDLQEAGPAGALRMKQLANATDEEIARANRAWKRGQDAMKAFVDFKVPPKRVMIDNREGLTAIERIRRALAEIKDKSVTVRVTQDGVAQTPGFGPQEKAEGGPIYGPGTGTSDSIPAYLSNGEYVVKAAAVEKYGVHMFDRLNAMHFATGGSADRKRKPNVGAAFYSPDNTNALQAAIDRLTDVSRAQTEALEESTSAQNYWAGKMAEAGQNTLSNFGLDLFSKSENPWAASSGGGPLSNLAEVIAGLQERIGLQTQLGGLGLTGNALSQLLTGSNSDISALLQSGGVGQYASLFSQYQALSAQAQSQAGQLSFGMEYSAAAAETTALRGDVQQLQIEMARVTTLLARNVAANERMANEAPERTGAEVGRVINEAGSKGHRERKSQGVRRG